MIVAKDVLVSDFIKAAEENGYEEEEGSSMNVTVDEVIAAAEQNGLLWAKTWFVTDSDNNIVAACILGQAAINLSVDEMSLAGALNDLRPNSGDSIMTYNDEIARSYGGALERLKGLLNPYKGKTLKVRKRSRKFNTKAKSEITRAEYRKLRRLGVIPSQSLRYHDN